MILTPAQRAALRAVYLRTTEVPSFRGFLAFRRKACPGPDCIMIPFAGMWLGIEADGYTHS